VPLRRNRITTFVASQSRVDCPTTSLPRIRGTGNGLADRDGLTMTGATPAKSTSVFDHGFPLAA
jgi:hypothetical protein